ncbi:LAMI_0H17436g1_1 [Lachancea mirantina]|uniref:Diphthine--ammonia ligase n=1 Tax=Lachancea mirantina TaxID=1230905 RepID=A0A1G4KJ61_9SACH|nr:LAMI_0H17436g1_1 [Lachancea mirantina]
MKFLGLISGGKDSCYSILHSIYQGHELVAFGNLYPADTTIQELDSLMFQTVGHDIVSLYSRCTGLPLIRRPISSSSSKNVSLNYRKTEGDEIEELYELLKEAKQKIPDLGAINVGAILSSYQRTRVEDVCSRLGLVVLSYLWQRDQTDLMKEMCVMSKSAINQDVNLFDARIIKVAAAGLDDRHLGKTLPEIFPALLRLNSLYDVHVCGEGGEFETMVLDAPFFTKGFLEPRPETWDNVHSEGGVHTLKMVVDFKEREAPISLETSLQSLPVPELLESAWWDIATSLSEKVTISSGNKSAYMNEISAQRVPVSFQRVGGCLFISNLQAKAGGDVERQLDDILGSLREELDRRNLDLSDVSHSTLTLKDMAHFKRVNDRYVESFNVSKIGPLPPSRSCIASDMLPEKSAVQLSVIVDAGVGLLLKGDKNGLHVQSRSYWAPCNIGPYSQAIWSGADENRVTTISGQIALIPASMEMIESLSATICPSISQSVLSLRHFHKVKEAIEASYDLEMVCYISKDFMVPVVTETWAAYQRSKLCKQPLGSKKLIILKVSSLPRNALCEWVGTVCSTLTRVKDYTSDSHNDDPGNDCQQGEVQDKQADGWSKFSICETPVESNRNVRLFSSGFFDLEDLQDLPSVPSSNFQVRLFYDPRSNFDDTSIPGAEINYVEAVYDAEGNERSVGFQTQQLVI